MTADLPPLERLADRLGVTPASLTRLGVTPTTADLADRPDQTDAPNVLADLLADPELADIADTGTAPDPTADTGGRLAVTPLAIRPDGTTARTRPVAVCAGTGIANTRPLELELGPTTLVATTGPYTDRTTRVIVTTGLPDAAAALERLADNRTLVVAEIGNIRQTGRIADMVRRPDDRPEIILVAGTWGGHNAESRAVRLAPYSAEGFARLVRPSGWGSYWRAAKTDRAILYRHYETADQKRDRRTPYLDGRGPYDTETDRLRDGIERMSAMIKNADLSTLGGIADTKYGIGHLGAYLDSLERAENADIRPPDRPDGR